MANASDAAQGTLAIEQELVGERASALQRIGKAFEQSLDDLAEADRALLSASTPTEPLTRRRREAHDRVERQLWYLLVQREAAGIRDHRDLFAAYPIPADVRPQYRPG